MHVLCAPHAKAFCFWRMSLKRQHIIFLCLVRVANAPAGEDATTFRRCIWVISNSKFSFSLCRLIHPVNIFLIVLGCLYRSFNVSSLSHYFFLSFSFFFSSSVINSFPFFLLYLLHLILQFLHLVNFNSTITEISLKNNGIYS